MLWEDNSGQWKRVVAFVVFVATTTFLFVHYYRNTQLSSSNHPRLDEIWVQTTRSLPPQSENLLVICAIRDMCNNLDTTALDENFGPVSFDINGSDVMVFLHMQKTGGTTFGRQLVRNLILPKECDILDGRKRRNCLRPNSDIETWLFSRYSTGWACGLHSDWTALHECVDDKLNELERKVKTRKYFYVTILRDPIKRYLSEWKHVARGATWKTSKFGCDYKENDIPLCFEGDTWSGVTLEEFTSCPYNMATNRQTRMLADLRLVNCYERWLNQSLTQSQVKEMEDIILQSAMENLQNMTFFGLVEEQKKMQAMFEYIFPYKFKQDFIQYNSTHISSTSLTNEELAVVRERNEMDIKLYDFAKRLFKERYKQYLQTKKI